MQMTTLYFNTGVSVSYPRELTTFCKQIGAYEDSMWDLVGYKWPTGAATTVRKMARAQGKTHPIFQASVNGTRELAAHLLDSIDNEAKEDWQYFLTAIVLHQLGYSPSLDLQFDW